MCVVRNSSWRLAWICFASIALSGGSAALAQKFLAVGPSEPPVESPPPWQDGGSSLDAGPAASAPSALPTIGAPSAAASQALDAPTTARSAFGGPALTILGPAGDRATEQTPVLKPDTNDKSTEAPPSPTARHTVAAPALGPPTPDPSLSPEASGLKPVPDQEMDPNAPPEIFAASFGGLTPGETTMSEVREKLGEPLEVSEMMGLPAHLYSLESFDHIEVIFDRAAVVKSIIIRLPKPVDVRQFTAAMPHLQNIEPVMICNELGFVLGQSFPERGVLCAFEPADAPHEATMMVNQVIFEPVAAESFLLRAEVLLDQSWPKARRDLTVVTKLDPLNARGHWLLARVHLLEGNYQEALNECTRAVQIDATDPEYLVTRADVLRQMNRIEEAIAQAEKAIPLCGKRQHIKARTYSLLGDLWSTGPASDYLKAYEKHAAAIETAEPLAESPHPAIRIAAKEVLIDAHLGAAHDIAWGQWEQKELAVPRWLEKAQGFAEELIEKEGRGDEPRLRVATRALTCYVGMKGQLDPAPWLQEVDRVGRKMIAAAADPHQKAQHQWNIGLVLFDAVQIYQMRKEYDKALAYGEQAVHYLEQGVGLRQGFADAYILARLYFRLGVIHAIGLDHHDVAVTWFDKAVPIFNQSADHISPHEIGRFGETFVSMGVSYWQAEKKDRAVELTERGVELIDLGVEQQILPISKLETPYSNLAIMLRKLGRTDEADRYFDLAIRTKSAAQR